MWGLLRLLLLSFLLGAFLALVAFAVRALRLPFFPEEGEEGVLRRMRLPRAVEPYRLPGRRPPRWFRAVADFFIAVLCGLLLPVFYFAANDGIPRLFSLVAVALGALLLRRLAGRPLWRLLILLSSLLRAIWLTVGLLSLLFLCRIGKRFLAFLRKVAELLIKRGERLYTKHASQRYRRRTLGYLDGRLRRRLTAALDAEGE